MGVAQPTIKSWIGVLEAAYAVRLIPPWFRNYGKRLVKAPKLYLLDAALVCALSHQPDGKAALVGAMGAMSDHSMMRYDTLPRLSCVLFGLGEV